MKIKLAKLINLLVVLALVVGMLPMTIFATDSTQTLTEGAENEVSFALEEQADTASFAFTASEAGKYVFYFRNMTTDSHSLGWQGPEGQEPVEYHINEQDFRGFVWELAAGETLSYTFGVAMNENDEYVGETYSATVGIARTADSFDSFDLSEGVYEEDPNFVVSLDMGTWYVNVYPGNLLAWGFDWSATVENTEILELQEGTVEGQCYYSAAFALKSEGETTITFTATKGETTVSKTYTVAVTAGGQGGENNENTFADQTELLALLESGCTDTILDYTGDGAMTLTADVTIPESVAMSLCEHELIIAEGATLTVEGDLAGLSGLTVNGSLVMRDRYLWIDNIITISGFDNITLDEGMKIVMVGHYADLAELKTQLAALAQDHYTDERMEYRMEFAGSDTTGLVLQENLEIPAYAHLAVSQVQSFSVASGATLTLTGSAEFNVPTVIEGSLVNNGSMDVNSTLNLSGSYSGSSDIAFHADSTVTELASVFTCTNLDDFDITSETDPEGNHHWFARYAGDLIRLGTPTDLTWGVNYLESWEDDGEGNVQVILTPETMVGSMSWKTALPDQAMAEVTIYCVETGETWGGTCGFGTDFEPEYRSTDLFCIETMESGTYYFTVTSLGDYETYRNSETATSGTFVYTKPEQRLAQCTELSWDNLNNMWTGPSDTTYLDGYHIEYYFCETEDGEYEQFGGTSGRPGADAESCDRMPDDFLQDRGIGYYKFRVRALSSDISACCNGEWSELSPALNLTEVTLTNAALDKVLEAADAEDADPDAIREAVQEIGTEDLKIALLTDQDNTGTTQKLAALEDMAGGAADVEVTKDAAAFSASDVTVVGANLNNKKNEEDQVTLLIDKPEKTQVIPERYDSAVAVRFSMTLTNVEDPENLAVPVKISLPVPDSINPDFLVVLHYCYDGTVEHITPYIREANGKVYADFVLTSFSDFVMTQVHVHEAKLVEAAAADCVNDGHTAYYECSCGKWFADAACATEIEDHTSVVIAATGHTPGQWQSDDSSHWKACGTCGTVVDEKAAHADADGDGKCDVCGKTVKQQETQPTETQPDETTAPTTTPTQPSGTAGNPNTGDSFNGLLWLTVMVISGAAVLVLVLKKKSFSN